jgi:hypothetical protein
MKPLFSIIILGVLFFACGTQEYQQPKTLSELEKIAADSTNYTTIKWIDSVANFGTIKEGEVIEVNFTFKNTGNKPLYIINVQPGCGCTSPSFTKEAIAPQKEGWVKGVFNSLNQRGDVHKTIRVITNTTNNTEHILTFTGVVINKS